MGTASSHSKQSALFLECQGGDDLGQKEIVEMLSSVQVSHPITEVAVRIYRMHAVNVSSLVCSTLLPILLHPGMLIQVRVLASQGVSQLQNVHKHIPVPAVTYSLRFWAPFPPPICLSERIFLQRTLLSGPPSSFVIAFPMYLF